MRFLPNPFKDLIDKNKVNKEPFEECEGAMSCQTTGCFEVAIEGKYYTNLDLLIWECSQGHQSKIENYEGRTK